MNYLISIFLGFVQGLTEFLPVSSSGHLVILQSILPEFKQPGILFDVILHFGTMLAVLVFFRKKLLNYLHPKYILLLIVGTVPAALAGYFFKSQIEGLFSSIRIVGIALLISGIFNLLTDRFNAVDKKLTPKSAFIVGVFQAVAIIPGLSRSGSTIFASVAQGIRKEVAAEFSFVLSIPVVLGANILEIVSKSSEVGGEDIIICLTGFIASAVFGYLAIKLIFDVIKKGRFIYFAYYCFILGALVLI